MTSGWDAEARRWLAAVLVAGAGLVSGAAQATLIDQGDGTVLDNATGLEWVKDGSLGGLRNWSDAMSWATGLPLDGGGWRGPTLGELSNLYSHIKSQTTCGGGVNCTGDQSPIENIEVAYWSATEVAVGASTFIFSNGNQSVQVKNSSTDTFAWAVRTAQATLIDQGDGTVLDTATGLEWVKDGSLGGLRNWSDAMSWATGLPLDGGGWRGPTLGELSNLYSHIKSQTTCGGGVNCTGDQSPIENIEVAYWSATEVAVGASTFIFSNGNQSVQVKNSSTDTFAWAVRTGDVAAVPVPGSVALLSIALAGLGWSCRRK